MKSTSFGARMLQRMGWTEGTGLGAHRNGVLEPVQVIKRPEKLGIGAERRPFQDAWWERAMEEAYGKGENSEKGTRLLSACEGRRCRPHGKSKLERIAAQDRAITMAKGAVETTARVSCGMEKIATKSRKDKEKVKRNMAPERNLASETPYADSAASDTSGTTERIVVTEENVTNHKRKDGTQGGPLQQLAARKEINKPQKARSGHKRKKRRVPEGV